MRGKPVIFHTLDSLLQIAVEPMEKLTNKPVIKPTLPPAISAPRTTCHQHRMPEHLTGYPGSFCNFYAALSAALANCCGLAVTPLLGCYTAATRQLHGYYLALAQSRIASKKRSHSLSCSSSIHSFGVCAWAMSPGPQMMLCTPARWNWPASVP